MKLDIIIKENKGNGLLLSVRPPKDGDTQYACGFHCIGSWASRLQQHDDFLKTSMGKYIVHIEMQLYYLNEALGPKKSLAMHDLEESKKDFYSQAGSIDNGIKP